MKVNLFDYSLIIKSLFDNALYRFDKEFKVRIYLKLISRQLT